MMKIEKKIMDVVEQYEEVNPDMRIDYEVAMKMFNEMVESGRATRRGNRLADPSQRSSAYVQFNSAQM